MPHKFSVGETVEISSLPAYTKPAGPFAVVRLLPQNSMGEPQYRIKAERESYERLVRESQISLLKRA